MDLRRFLASKEADYYGQQWGDPRLSGWRYWIAKLRHGKRVPGDLSKVVKRYIRPYVDEQSVVLEIGAGGGRWTQFLTAARELHLVELNPQFFPYLAERFAAVLPRIHFHETTGYELGAIPAASVDFVFSFGTFGHIDPSGIDLYLGEIRRVLRDGGTAVIHYADRTKRFFRDLDERELEAFSEMGRKTMEGLLARHGLRVRAHDVRLLNHSNIVVFGK
jgi:SAM-dependent methyltransferase